MGFLGASPQAPGLSADEIMERGRAGAWHSDDDEVGKRADEPADVSNELLGFVGNPMTHGFWRRPPLHYGRRARAKGRGARPVRSVNMPAFAVPLDLIRMPCPPCSRSRPHGTFYYRGLRRSSAASKIR